MLEHGDFEIEIIGNVVHTYPVGGFNEHGIKRIRQSIMNARPYDEKWALYEHPKDVAGLTPEAALEIALSYKEFCKNDCVVIALEVCSTWQNVIAKRLKKELPIPLYFDSNGSRLEALIHRHLHE